MNEARLEDTGSGLAPVSEGWFVVNARDAAWLANAAFGRRCIFESDPRVLRQRPDLEPRRFDQVGVTLAVLEPQTPSSLYHAESEQEGFLVLAGSCTLVVEGEERLLGAWDYVHCPPGTAHGFVATGDAPCVLLMLGARTGEHRIVYPADPVAHRHGLTVESETDSAREAYAGLPHWQPARLPAGVRLPWEAD